MLFYLLLLIEQLYHCNTVRILDQSSPSIQAQQNKLISQHFTDLNLNARLRAADDFALPFDMTTQNCSAIEVNMKLLRYKHNENPSFLTIHLFSNNVIDNKPGQLIFSQNINNTVWDDSLVQKVFDFKFRLNRGQISAHDGKTVFDLENPQFVHPGQRLWLSLFATGTRNYSFSGYEENCLFWVTHENSSVMTSDNRQYYFIDEKNIMGLNLFNWSPASKVESLLGLNSVSLNLAWSVDLLCTPPTRMPTTEAPVEVIYTTDAPTIIIFNETTDEPTTAIPWRNQTIFGDTSQLKIILLSVLIPLGFVALCCLCCIWCYRCRRHYLKTKKRKTQKMDPLNYNYTQGTQYNPLSRTGNDNDDDRIDLDS